MSNVDKKEIKKFTKCPIEQDKMMIAISIISKI